MASGGLDFCVLSTSFQKNDTGWPQQPPTEKVLKFNMIFHDSTKTFFFFKTRFNMRNPVANPRSTIHGFSFFYNYYIANPSPLNVFVFVDIVLSVLVNSMLIYGILRERSAYFPPWFIFYVLNLLVVS